MRIALWQIIVNKFEDFHFQLGIYFEISLINKLSLSALANYLVLFDCFPITPNKLQDQKSDAI